MIKYYISYYKSAITQETIRELYKWDDETKHLYRKIDDSPWKFYMNIADEGEICFFAREIKKDNLFLELL